MRVFSIIACFVIISSCSPVYVVEKIDSGSYMKTVYLKAEKSDNKQTITLQGSDAKKFPKGSRVRIKRKKELKLVK